MFDIRRAQLQKLQSAKSDQSSSTMFEDLGFSDPIQPLAKTELSTAFSEAFEQYSRVTCYTKRVKKVFAFDALSLLEGKSLAWRSLYEVVADSSEELLHENNILSQKQSHSEDETDPHLQKVQGEFLKNKG